jgi:hypothetical protein
MQYRRTKDGGRRRLADTPEHLATAHTVGFVLAHDDFLAV